MMRFDQLLHETIDEMADEMKAPSAALVSVSIARGRHIRRGRRLIAAGGALLAVAAIVLPWAITSRPGGPPATGAPAASGAPRDPGSTGLAGGWVVTGTGTQVLDRATGEYVSMGGKTGVLPAPVGDRILVDATPDPPQVMGIRGTPAGCRERRRPRR